MAITLVAAASVNGTSQTTLGITLPAIEADDFMLVFCSGNSDGGGRTFSETAAGGWTKFSEEITFQGGDHTAAIFYKKLSGSESDPTFSYGVSDWWGLTYMIFRGVDASSPIDVAYVKGSHWNEGANNSNPTNQAITTVTDGAVVVLWESYDANHLSALGAPSGYTGGALLQNGIQNGATAYKTITTATTETPGAWTHSTSGSSGEYQTTTLALKPGAGSGGGGGSTPGPVRAVEQARVVPSHEAFTMGLRHGPGA